ncbi:MAG TPA: MG2 domain-containing protein [Gemmatimonadaceae bacterium]|nr:MG2 domain-containing protein [Gemmatimonadaceae bacterium]
MLPRFALLAALSLAPLHASAPLKVLRVTPLGAAAPGTAITVTFDRPVAGSLDRTVDPRHILRIEPAVAGTAEWRDPVTIVFRPAALLRSGERYTVTVSGDFRAMDGSALEAPYRFTFRVRGPQLVTGSPMSPSELPRFLGRSPAIELVWSAPVELARVSAAAYLEMDRACGGAIVRLRATGQRAVRRADPWPYHAPQVARDTVIPPDSLRRVVRLVPETPLPLGCGGELVAPTELGAAGSAPLARWPFATYGSFSVKALECHGRFCPTGPMVVRFSTPVRGAEVLRHVKLVPVLPFTIRDTAAVSDEWTLDARLQPRTVYAITVDTAIRDAFGQRLQGAIAMASRTTGYAPSIDYPYGHLTVERNGFGTLAVQHVNVDTLVVVAAPVPDTLEAQFLRRSQWSWGDLWTAVRPGATTRKIAVRAGEDRIAVTGVKLPASAPRRGRTLWAVRVTRTTPDTLEERRPNIALVQVTDLGVHAKLGAESGVVWVTGASDGEPRAGATATLYDFRGRAVATATTDAQGLARFGRFRVAEGGAENEGEYDTFEGYVDVVLGDDRALVGVSEYDPDLSPWRFDISGAWGGDRLMAAGALFTERGIYRPGETVHAKTIIRDGFLGALGVPAGDSVRWRFSDRDGGVMKDTVMRLSAFGTADLTLAVPADAPLGQYDAAVQVRRQGRWTDLAHASYRVAEYRPPEFLVDVTGDDRVRHPGDSVRATVEARYLFGAPMGRAQVTWQARQATLSPWELDIPHTDGFFIGESGWWWEEDDGAREVSVFASGVDTLDAAGRRTLAVVAPKPAKGRAARLTLAATVADVNRQVVGGATSVTVHPADFYIAARPSGRFFWVAGEPQRIDVMAVRPNGERVPGVAVQGVVVRREWHQVHRERGGVAETVGEWVTDTVGRCTLTTGTDPQGCAVTPRAGGTYLVTFRARDARGREARTALYRWATGKGWVPWYDETRFKMDVIPDRTRYTVGDTATILFAAPFTGAEAWITVEREGVIEQRRMRIENGSTTLKFPITEAYVPNAYVSIFVARGRSEPPGRLDDPGRPTIRVGYAELRVTPEVKRLAVEVQPLATEYRPGDSARVRLRVRDGAGRGQRSEVTLWAVDEGVLALTGYKTPDPIDLLYQPRGLGLRLASNLVSVAPQIPEGEKGGRAPGGGGGLDGADVLRSRFKTTAFFLGTVVTDDDGSATAVAKLPDNLTTFRVMAVAVTAGDRYGSGAAKLLVTRPLIVRAALPRFVRAGDSLVAGAVVNARGGGTPTVKVEARSEGIEMRGDRARTVTLAAGRGAEVRWPFRARPGADSVTLRFGVTGGRDADAVQARLPVRPDYAPRAHTISGIVRDSATVSLALPAGIDPARSRLTLSLGGSPLAVIRGAYGWLRVYPYFCTEQVASEGLPLAALLRAEREAGATIAPPSARRDLELAVWLLSARQRSDGGIGYWSAVDWTTPWLTAYAGGLLLDARDAGIAVSDSVLARLAGYLSRELNDPTMLATPVAQWYDDRRTRLSDRVMAVELLRRLGRPDVAAENQLLAAAPQLAWEDRVALAELLAVRGDGGAATRLLAPAWSQVAVEGRRAVLRDVLVRRDFLFDSRFRPMARLLRATLAAQPDHPLVGPMVETLAQQGRVQAGWIPNTQDFGWTVKALADFERRQRAAGASSVRVRGGGRLLFEAGTGAAPRDSTLSLAGLLAPASGETRELRLALDARGGGPAYYYLTVSEVPLERPVTPSQQGIQVERWYEKFDAPAPIVAAGEGELVRVRLRITVPEDRQFVVLDDPLPAGLEAVDLSLRTAATVPGPGAAMRELREEGREPDESLTRWGYGSWDSGWWSPFDHKEIRDDRVVYFATVLWKGTYTTSYIARATTPGVFVRPPAHAEEMYNPAVNGRSDGGVFTVRERK